jgi:hypothetical protein
MQAVQASRDPQLAARLTMESLSLPAAQWPSLAEQTRTMIYRAFRKPSASSKPNQNPSERSLPTRRNQSPRVYIPYVEIACGYSF